MGDARRSSCARALRRAVCGGVTPLRQGAGRRDRTRGHWCASGDRAAAGTSPLALPGTHCLRAGRSPARRPSDHAPVVLRTGDQRCQRAGPRGGDPVRRGRVERSGPQGATLSADCFSLATRRRADVGWHCSQISIRRRHGFRPNTVYTITMLPGMADLHNNVRRTGAALTFSTGPTIPMTIVRGRVFDWMTGLEAPRAFVQAYAPELTPRPCMSRSRTRRAPSCCRTCRLVSTSFAGSLTRTQPHAGSDRAVGTRQSTSPTRAASSCWPSSTTRSGRGSRGRRAR